MKYLALILLLLSGCGYQFAGGKMPGDFRTLYLPLAINTTAEPLLENALASPVTAVLARQQGIELVESEQAAEAVLLSTIKSYEVEPISYGSDDRITEFQAALTVRYELKQRETGRLIWQAELKHQQSYRAAADKNSQEDLEAAAIDSMAKNLADDLVYRLVTRF